MRIYLGWTGPFGGGANGDLLAGDAALFAFVALIYKYSQAGEPRSSRTALNPTTKLKIFITILPWPLFAARTII